MSVLSSLFSTLDSRSIGEIASRFGVPEQAVSQGLETSTATLLGGLANKAGDSTWMSQLFKLVSQAPSNVSVGDVASAAIDPSQASSGAASLLDSGKRFLGLAFGGNQSSIFDAVARSTGLRSGIVSSLMGMAAPLMMTALGRLVREDHMNPTGLSRLLANEAESVRDLLPAGVSNLLSTTSPSIPTATASTRPVAIGSVPEPTSRSRGWLWLLPLLLIPALLYWGYWARHPVVHTVVVPAVPPFIARTVPGNLALNVPQDSVEARLLSFIQDPTRGIDPALSFNFDHLLFNTNSATLRPGSQEQLGNIAAILRAYPNVHIKIGGHTDNIGSSQQNLKLSQQRANGVMAQLVVLGIFPDRLEAQGYGDQAPVAANTTAEGRAKNRRISMSVTQK
jgi:outer membrane protein OmpA-like peptidoglycan-associated protein